VRIFYKKMGRHKLTYKHLLRSALLENWQGHITIEIIDYMINSLMPSGKGRNVPLLVDQLLPVLIEKHPFFC